MRSYIQNNDMNDPERYKVVEEEHLEIDNFIDYNLTVLWGAEF